MACSGLVVLSSACRKEKKVESLPTVKSELAKATSAALPVAPELTSNQLGSMPGIIYQSQAKSPIFWQPWTKETLARAKASNRLIFAVVALPQYAGFDEAMRELSSDPEIVAAIHQKYVPVLIDGESSREFGQLTAVLCAEVKRPLRLPLFLWMTSEANPVTWVPAIQQKTTNIASLFKQSDATVTELWDKDSSYVMSNSALDNKGRMVRMTPRSEEDPASQSSTADTLAGIRQLTSLYDPITRTFDEAGGFIPTGVFDLLSTTVAHPGVPADLKSRCLTVIKELSKDVIGSAMIDPIDGGAFSIRKYSYWSFPDFSRDCFVQARSALALLNCYRVTNDPLMLHRALEIIKFTEKSYRTDDGLFVIGLALTQDPSPWLWTVDDIKKALPPEDVDWWIKMTGMKENGNLTIDVDPGRKYIRENSLGMSMSPAEIAASQSLSLTDFNPRFNAAREKLLKIRDARVTPPLRDTSATASASFQMASVYAAAFGVTGDEAFRQKAVATLKRCQEVFVENGKLRNFTQEAPSSIGAARAFTYVHALQATLDLCVIDSDPAWLDWNAKIATAAAELFVGDRYIKECSDDAKLIDLPLSDSFMLFSDSTAGLLSQAAARLAEHGRPLPSALSDLVVRLPQNVARYPLPYTDHLRAALARHFKVSVIYGEQLSPELKLALQRLPNRVFHPRPATSGEKVPSGSVWITYPDGKTRVLSDVKSLKEALLPFP